MFLLEKYIENARKKLSTEKQIDLRSYADELSYIDARFLACLKLENWYSVNAPKDPMQVRKDYLEGLKAILATYRSMPNHWAVHNADPAILALEETIQKIAKASLTFHPDVVLTSEEIASLSLPLDGNKIPETFFNMIEKEQDDQEVKDFFANAVTYGMLAYLKKDGKTAAELAQEMKRPALSQFFQSSYELRDLFYSVALYERGKARLSDKAKIDLKEVPQEIVPEVKALLGAMPIAATQEILPIAATPEVLSEVKALSDLQQLVATQEKETQELDAQWHALPAEFEQKDKARAAELAALKEENRVRDQVVRKEWNALLETENQEKKIKAKNDAPIRDENKKSYWLRSIVSFLALIVTLGLSLIPAVLSFYHKNKELRRAAIGLKETDQISNKALMDDVSIPTSKPACFFNDFYLTMGARGLPVYNQLTPTEKEDAKKKVKITPTP